MKEFPELTLGNEKHEYRLNGIIIPSCTQITKPNSDFYYKGIDEGILETAAIRGRAVHEIIENYIRFGIEDRQAEFAQYFNGFKEWEAECKPKYIASEFKCYHKIYRYGCTIDCLCEIDNLITLVDWKTTSIEKEKPVRLQLEGYNMAVGSHQIAVDQLGVLYLHADGTKHFILYRPNEGIHKIIFIGLVNLYNYNLS